MNRHSNDEILDEIRELERRLVRKRDELAARASSDGNDDPDARARRWRDLAARIGAVSKGGHAVDEIRRERRG